MVHVKNFTAKAVRAPLALLLDERNLARQEIALGAHERRVLIVPYDGALAGKLVARLEVADDFATDNRAYLVLADRAPLRVLYVGPGNPYLIRLLQLFADVEVASAPDWEAAQAQSPFDVVIFDRVAAPALTRGNFILINTIAPNLPLERAGTMHNPRVAMAAKHPLTAGLSLGDLTIREASRVTLKGEGTVLARAGTSPLLYALESGGLRVLFLGFDLLASDLPLRVAFPVLFHNALEWFQPRSREFPGTAVKAGAPVTLKLANSTPAVEISSPSGKRELLSAPKDSLVFADTFEAGFYHFTGGGRSAAGFAVNLLDEEESAIVPRAVLHGAADKQAASSGALDAVFALWPLLLGAVWLILGVELWLAFRQGLPLYPIAMRGAALAVLALAVINPRLLRSTSALDVILGVDLSRSVGQEGREKAQAVIESAARLQTAEARTGLLSFGRAPEWESLPRARLPALDFSARLDREETDVQAALQAALAQIGEGRQGKILLISDGNENRGETARVVPLLRAQDVQVWTLPVGLSRGRNEVYLSDLTAPRLVDSAEGFEVRAVVESLRETPARVRLLRDGVLHTERSVQLKAGSNPLAFRDSIRERGNHSYELLVEAADDTLAENNLLQGVVAVKGPPRVLLLSAEKESQRVISRVLQVQGYAVVEAAPQSHPLSLSELSAYDLLVLDNVPAFHLTHAKMENIEKYARDLGGGVLVIGGAQSYGAGGYFRTPLERILPVDMRPPARLEMPHVALAVRDRQVRQHGFGRGRQHQARPRQGRGDRRRRHHESDGSSRHPGLRRRLGLGAAVSPGGQGRVDLGEARLAAVRRRHRSLQGDGGGAPRHRRQTGGDQTRDRALRRAHRQGGLSKLDAEDGARWHYRVHGFGRQRCRRAAHGGHRQDWQRTGLRRPRSANHPADLHHRNLADRARSAGGKNRDSGDRRARRPAQRHQSE